MKKVLFVDRDGTLIKEPEDQQIDSYEKLEFLPGVITNLAKIMRELDYELVMVTNQDGLGTESHPEENFWPVHNQMLKIFENEGVVFRDVHIDRTFPNENAKTRKPHTAMLSMYFSDEYDLKNSFVVGDRLTDIELAKNLGAMGIFIDTHEELGADELNEGREELEQYIALRTRSWSEIYSFLKGGPRKGNVHRKTNETDIHIKLNLDGSGKSSIDTGLKFFDHMLEQLSKHGSIDLDIKVNGDLEVDEHHTIEDTAIALGEAFFQAMKDKMGMQRYGFYLPMDDSLANVALDFGGRSWLVWKADFNREKIGDMPTEMFMHFFKSFCDAAKCNLNIKVEGQNEHHKIEAIFKAWAKSIKMAVKRDLDNMELPSTKGVL